MSAGLKKANAEESEEDPEGEDDPEVIPDVEWFWNHLTWKQQHASLREKKSFPPWIEGRRLHWVVWPTFEVEVGFARANSGVATNKNNNSEVFWAFLGYIPDASRRN